MNKELKESVSSTCTKCGRIPEDILLLGCHHNLCLDCAANSMRNDISNNNLTVI